MSAFDSNFHSVEAPDEQLYRLGALAEKYFTHKPISRLIILSQMAKLPGKLAAGRCSPTMTSANSYSKVLRRPSFECSLPWEVGNLLHGLRVVGNQEAQAGMDEDDDSFRERKLAAFYVRTCHDAALKLGHLNYARQATDEK